jgi:hypothetical protein
MQYNFTWCDLIDSTNNVTVANQPMACSGAMYAGGADFNPLTDPNNTCYPYSGSSTGRDDTTVSGISELVSYNDENGTTQN